MERTRKIGVVISAVSLACLILSAYGLFTTILIIRNEGSVTWIGAFWDAGFTKPVTVINWTDPTPPTPNSTNTRQIYVKNFGVKTLNLSMVVQNWVPANALNYMSVSWNLERSLLAGGAYDTAVITLVVHNNITETWNTTKIGAFSFDLNITGTG
jgi:hypothetical protein